MEAKVVADQMARATAGLLLPSHVAFEQDDRIGNDRRRDGDPGLDLSALSTVSDRNALICLISPAASACAFDEGIFKRCMSQLPGGAVRLKTRQNVYECESVPDQMCATAHEHSTVT